MNIAKLLAEALRAGADAADRIDPCLKCGAPPGALCVTTTTGTPWGKSHTNRLPGDPVLSFALRSMANYLEQATDKLE